MDASNSSHYSFDISSTTAASYGIQTLSDSTIVGCTSTNQYNNASTPNGSTGAGIGGGIRTTVRDCTSNFNRGDGIIAGDGCLIIGNNCGKDGYLGDGAGILVTGTAGRIEGNQATICPRGLQVHQSRNFIARNTTRSNTSNFEIAAGNRVAQIVVPTANAAAISGNGASTDGFTNVDPWANFSN